MSHDPIGTLVSRKAPILANVARHYGIVVGPNLVAHADSRLSGELRVMVDTIEKFSRGMRLRRTRPRQPVSAEELLARVDEVKAGGRRFDLLSRGERWNCETFARYVLTGTPRSWQAVALKTAVLGSAAVSTVVVGGTVVYVGKRAWSGVKTTTREAKQLAESIRQLPADAAAQVVELRAKALEAVGLESRSASEQPRPIASRRAE